MLTSLLWGMTTVTAEAGLLGNSSRSWSPTWRAEAESGSTRSSGNPHRTPRKGAPSTSSTAITGRLTKTTRRITNFVDRYQKNCCNGRRGGSGRRSSQRPNRRTSSASMRSPSSTIAAGATNSAATAVSVTTAAPAKANDFRKYIGKSASAPIEKPTVNAENNTVRPAVAMVRASAVSRSAPSARSSRKRLVISSV